MLIRIYLVAYFALVGAATAALWLGGVLARLPGQWVALTVLVAVALGVLLGIVSFRRSGAPKTPA